MVVDTAAGGGCGQWHSDRWGCQHGEALVPSTAAQLARRQGLLVWNPGSLTARRASIQAAQATGALCRGVGARLGLSCNSRGQQGDGGAGPRGILGSWRASPFLLAAPCAELPSFSGPT